MSGWWYVIAAVVIIAVVAFLVMRGRASSEPGPTPAAAERDYRDERETSRLGGMSDEDRAWEAASLERNRKAREADQQRPGSD